MFVLGINVLATIFAEYHQHSTGHISHLKKVQYFLTAIKFVVGLQVQCKKQTKCKNKYIFSEWPDEKDFSSIKKVHCSSFKARMKWNLINATMDLIFSNS
jgi:hypothetical protein